MKLPLVSILFGLANLAHGQDFIRQIQTISGSAVINDIPVASDNGQVQSKSLATDSAIFQLYAKEAGPNNTQTIKKLDEKTVGTFLPTASVRFFSEDPHFPARTRADKPYGAAITISGMQTGPAVPDYARNLIVNRGYKLYDPVTYQPTASEGQYADAFVIRSNGVFTDNAISQRIPGDETRPTKVSGEESITVLLQPEAEAKISEKAKSVIQVWPVATGEILNLEEGKTYRALPPIGSVRILDLYPKSVTYTQIYNGPFVIGTTGTPLPSTVVSFDTYLPQNANLALTDLNDLLDKDGEYTLEVLTITPFNGGAPELIDKVTFRIQRTISVNATVTTME